MSNLARRIVSEGASLDGDTYVESLDLAAEVMRVAADNEVLKSKVEWAQGRIEEMDAALDAILKADVHAMGCLVPGGCDEQNCPHWIAVKATQDIADLQRIAITAGGR